jgi:hypothetical protein
MLSKRDKKGVKYLLETLEPRESILFNWNFFDTMLQKVTQAMFFEDTAAQILKDNPKLKEALQQKKIADHFLKS